MSVNARLSHRCLSAVAVFVFSVLFTVSAFGAADLALTKTNDVGGTVPIAAPSWTWTWTLTNVGDTAMTYSGAELIYDQLPDSNISYGVPNVSQNAGFVGAVSCFLVPGFSYMYCTGNVTINPGGTLTVTMSALAAAVGTFTNPRSGGTCYHGGFDATPVDSNAANNNCSDSVLVTSPNADLSVTKTNDVGNQSAPGGSWNWTWAVSNSAGAGAAANFAAGDTILADNLPNVSISYGAVSVATGGGTTGTVNCSIASSNLTCTAGTAVSMPASGTITVTVPATASAETVYVNPRAGGVCTVDPSSLITESDEGNNSCSNNVATTVADMVATKTNNVGGSTNMGAPSWTWTIQLQNIGSIPKSYSGFFFSDNLPNSGLTYGSPSVSTNANVTGGFTCSITTSNLVCNTASTVFMSGGVATISFTATASGPGVFGNPRAGGTCFVDDQVVGSPGEQNVANNACSDTVTVLAVEPDLSIVKSNDVGGQSFDGGSWTWTLNIANSAGSASAAAFTDGQTIAIDNLPSSGLTYGIPVVTSGGGTTGTIVCSIVSANLTCVASGSVSIPPGGTVAVAVPATATTESVFANPRAAGVCAVDPNLVIAEVTEANNSCSDSVTSISGDMAITKSNDAGGATTMNAPSWTWTLQAENAGTLAKVFANGATIITDQLPNTNVTYGSPGVSVNGSVTGTIACSIVSANLTCTASGGPVTFNGGGVATVTVLATASATGTYANPRAGGTCNVDGIASTPADVNNANNVCADSVTVAAGDPDLTVTKTNDTAGQSTAGGSWNWTLVIANAPATTQAAFANGATILRDQLPNGAIGYGTPLVSTGGGTTGTVNCAIAGFDLTCTASGAVTIPASGTITVTVPATAAAEQIFSNPRAGGVCAVDPNAVLTEVSDANNSCSDAVSTQTADLSVVKTNDAGGSTAISAPDWVWTVTITNAGTLAKTFADTTQVLVDNLPNANITYGAPNVVLNGSVSGGLSCTINVSSNLVCNASGALVFSPGGTATVTFNATASATGAFANPRGGGVCAVSTALGSPADINTANDSCADTVTVTALGAAPAVTKQFAPPSVPVGASSTLTITLSNPNAFAVTGVGFVDNYPAGLVNASSPSASTTCGAGVVTAAPLGSSLTLANGTIPASASCTVTVLVTPTAAGSMQNQLPAGSVTSSNAAPSGAAASATITAAPVTTIPALSWPGLAALMILLASAGWFIQRMNQ